METMFKRDFIGINNLNLTCVLPYFRMIKKCKNKIWTWNANLTFGE